MTTLPRLPRTHDSLIQDQHTYDEWHAALLPLGASSAMECEEGFGLYPPAMEFRVHTPDQPELFFYGDSRYEIYAAVLTVSDDENKKKITFGPSGWFRVEESTDYEITESVH